MGALQTSSTAAVDSCLFCLDVRHGAKKRGSHMVVDISLVHNLYFTSRSDVERYILTCSSVPFFLIHSPGFPEGEILPHLQFVSLLPRSFDAKSLAFTYLLETEKVNSRVTNCCESSVMLCL